MRPIYILTLSILCVALSACREKKSASTAADTQIEWRHTFWNFGEITKGEEVAHSFYFKNIGKEQLFIKKIETGCGCTTVKYDQKPISPGKEGKLEILFNSAGRYGKQYKEIRIFANVPEQQITLTIVANVKE